jgi:hypothetical protein
MIEIQGLDTIPKEIADAATSWGREFVKYLPGWSGGGEYNFRSFRDKVSGTQY